jgi:hypothetical protein
MPYLQPLGKLNSLGRTLQFSLPPGITCPGAGACKAFCYGKKGRYVFPVVREAYRKNLALTTSGTFVTTIIKEIRALRKRPKAIRIHGTGDFYDQLYLDRWVTIAKVFPDILFYCYTTSAHLDWTAFDQLPNTNRVLSHGGRLTGWDLEQCAIIHKVATAIVRPLPFFKVLDGSKDDAVAARAQYPDLVWLKPH